MANKELKEFTDVKIRKDVKIFIDFLIPSRKALIFSSLAENSMVQFFASQ